MNFLSPASVPEPTPSAYWRWRHRLANFQHGEQALFDGAWLGWFDHSCLHELDREFYARSPEYQDVAYNDGGLRKWESELVTKYVAPGSRVVVTAAGGGREVLALERDGYDVSGFECHPHLRAAANEHYPGGEERIKPVERDRFPITAGPVDAVLVGWGSYMLIPGRARRVRFLSDARAALRPGGTVIASFALRGATATPYLRVVWRISSAIRRWKMQPATELGDALAPNFIHLFSFDEMRAEFAAAELDVVDANACVGEDPYGWIVGRVSR